MKRFFDFALSKGADLEVVNDNYETVIERICTTLLIPIGG